MYVDVIGHGDFHGLNDFRPRLTDRIAESTNLKIMAAVLAEDKIWIERRKSTIKKARDRRSIPIIVIFIKLDSVY